MGFFSFLTRKSANSDKSSRNPIKSQAYDSTVASLPPILGTYPVAGNGPNVLDQLQRAARKRSEAQLSTLSRRDSASAAPPPVPRYRANSVGRPRTAPNNHHTTASLRPRSVARSIRGHNGGWPFTSEKNKTPMSNGAYELRNAPPVPAIAAHHRRSSSFDSFQGHGSIDILDAQGEIKPSNFRSRLHATGVREYDEDVAERNLGENGVDVRSAAAKAFYALSGSGSLMISPHEQAFDVHGNVYYRDIPAEDLDESAPPPIVARGELAKDEWTHRIRRQTSTDVGTMRPQSSSYSPWSSFARNPETLVDNEDAFKGVELRAPPPYRNLGYTDESMANRRRSFNAFASPPPELRTRPRPLSLHPSLSNFSSRSSSPPPPIPPMSRARGKSGTDRALEHFLQFGLPVSPVTTDEGTCTCGSQRTKKAPSLYSAASSEVTQRRQTSKRQSLVSLTPRTVVHEGIPHGIGRLEIESKVDESFDSPAPSPKILSRPRLTEQTSHVRPSSNNSWKAPIGHAQLENIHSASRPSSSSSVDKAFPRTRSLGGSALPSRQKLDDINEYIPIRTSSLVNVNNCLTPTTMSSGYSSNTFVRPQSQQTANTSIDAPLQTTSAKFGHERNLSDSTGDEREVNYSTYFTAAEDESTNTLGKLSHSFSNFSQSSQGTASGSRRGDHFGGTPLPAPLEVDYSSEDSFEAKRLGGEERLLFDDFISGDGSRGLPGLFDALSGPSSPIAPNTPQSATAKPSMRSIKSTPKKSKKRHNLRHSHSTPFTYSKRNTGYGSSSDDEDSDSFFDPEFEYLREQAFAIPDIRIHASSPGRMSMYGLPEDEEEDKIDTSTAARLRKELDRQKRRTVGHLPHAAHSKGKARVRRQRDDESDAADTEDWGPYR